MKAKRRKALASASGAHKAALVAAREHGRDWLRAAMPDLRRSEFGALNAQSSDFGSWYLWVCDDGVRVNIEAAGLPPAVWGQFTVTAVDRLWFQGCWPRGAENWGQAPEGEHLAEAYHRSEYHDVLELDAQGRALRMHMRGLDVHRVAAGLIAMRKPAVVR